jgi:hypothetical protein
MLCANSWDALNDWSGCPLGGNEMKIEKSRDRIVSEEI